MLIRLEVADKYSRAAFPQTLPHSAGNGREKGGAGAPERNNKSVFLGRNIYGWKNLSRWINGF